MSIYYGTVTGNTVMLSKEVCLTEGMTVEVRIPKYHEYDGKSCHLYGAT